MNTERAARLAVAAALAGQAALAVLNIGGPRWRAVDLDREHNLATWFQAGLLALVALLAVRAFVIEARILTRAGRPRAWAMAWLVIAAAFAYLAADEALVIHEGFLTAQVEARLAPASTLRLTLAWLLVFLPAIVGGVAFLLASFAARARMSPRLVVWGAAGLGAWVGALTLEGTAKAFFMPRNLYGLEVILEETLESLGSTAFAWAIWGYGGTLMRRFDGPGARAVPALRVPWGRVVTRTLALVIPAAIVGAAMIGNPHVLQRYVGDDLLKAGRPAEAADAYRRALAGAPAYRQAWSGLGVAELRRGDFAAAERAFAEVERLDPASAPAANDRGVALVYLERHGDAVEAFTRAVARDPTDAVILRNRAIALRRLGRNGEAAAALARAQALRPDGLEPVWAEVTLPAGITLAYSVHARLTIALEHTRAGRIDAAIAEYGRVAASTPGLAAAHLGLANELMRRRAVDRVAGIRTAVSVGGLALDPAPPATLFADWLHHPDGRLEALETTVPAAAGPADPRALGADAAEHYRRALLLGAGAPAELGLAQLARDAGRSAEAATRLAAARGAVPTLPALAPPAPRVRPAGPERENAP